MNWDFPRRYPTATLLEALSQQWGGEAPSPWLTWRQAHQVLKSRMGYAIPLVRCEEVTEGFYDSWELLTPIAWGQRLEKGHAISEEISEAHRTSWTQGFNSLEFLAPTAWGHRLKAGHTIPEETSEAQLTNWIQGFNYSMEFLAPIAWGYRLEMGQAIPLEKIVETSEAHLASWTHGFYNSLELCAPIARRWDNPALTNQRTQAKNILQEVECSLVPDVPAGKSSFPWASSTTTKLASPAPYLGRGRWVTRGHLHKGLPQTLRMLELQVLLHQQRLK